jgi:hypothetical protein
MQFNFEWSNGLVFGIQSDEIWPTTEENPNPNFDEPPDSMIVIYLGLIIFTIIFDNGGTGSPPATKNP